jgi:hypothetical protein
VDVYPFAFAGTGLHVFQKDLVVELTPEVVRDLCAAALALPEMN